MTVPFLQVPLFTWPAAPGGKLHTYAAGGTTPQTTWSDAAGTVPNSNPVTLDSTGSATVRGNGAYHFVLKDATDTTTLWDADNYNILFNWSPIIIPAPSSGTAFTINGAASSAVLNLVSGNGAAASNRDVQIERAGSTANSVAEGPNIALYDSFSGNLSILQQSGGQTEFWQYNGSWAQAMFFGTNAGVVIGAGAVSEGAGTLNVQNGIYVAGLAQSKYVACLRTQAQQTNGNGTLTPDAYLVSPSVPAGTYKVRLFLQFYESASATSPGFQFKMAVGGTVSGQSWLSANGTVNNATYTSLFGTFTTTVQLHPIQSSSVTGSDFLVCEGIVTTTTAGTISLTWSSYASGNGSFPAALNTNSYMEIEQSN